ncbi:MAG: hypothetical protein ABIZ34_04415 [Candidatus Limnocylindrales bacterium]
MDEPWVLLVASLAPAATCIVMGTARGVLLPALLFGSFNLLPGIGLLQAINIPADAR